MRKFLIVFVLFLLFVIPVGGIAYAWMMQNAGQVAMLRLDLGGTVGVAWETTKPVPVTLLMSASFGVGFGLATLLYGTWGFVMRIRNASLRRAAESGYP